jgi:SNF2 family DNA or RNA helicase
MTKTYGQARYNAKKNQWEISCEPHVALRLKRVFGKANSRDFGKIYISATVENCRDLEWFIARYPLEIKQADLLAQRASEHRERQSLVNDLLAQRRQPQDFPLALPLRHYQAEAAEMWLTARGLLLADDVGLGKTAVAIAGFNQPAALPALVVTLTHLPRQWEAECKKFAPGLRVHILKKGQPYDLADSKRAGLLARMPDVIISNYHKLAGWAETLAPLVRSVVFDECQELRHRGSQKYVAARHVAEACQFRLGLSATPIYNYGGEIFNVIDALCPEQLGTWEEFEREWCTWGWSTKPRIENPKAFGGYAREAGLMLRRTRTEVGRELPAITVVPHYVDADPAALAAMQGQAIELAKLILRQGQDFKGQKMQAAAEFDMRMRQATGIAKAPFVAEFVRFLAKDNDQPVVLYGWHREVYEIWKEKLRDLNPVLYTGSESPNQKEVSKQAFLSGQSKVLVISLRAGQGMDGLQDVCHVCVFGELDWSPGVHEQCIGRIHRDGQDEPVTAYYMLSTEGADPIMSDVLGIKKAQIEGLRDPNQELVTKLQIDQDYIKRLAEQFLASRGISFSEKQ